jgi:hypothetical protein
MNKFYDETKDVVAYDNFDQYEEYRHCTVAVHDTTRDEALSVPIATYDDVIEDLLFLTFDVFTIHQTKVKHEFELLRPLFGWFPADTIQRTFDVTTRYARSKVSDTLKQHWWSRFPACNVKLHNEPVATDTVFSDTPAVDCGATAAQLLVGRKSLVTDVYGLKTDKEFLNALEDNIRERGSYFVHCILVHGIVRRTIRIRT